MILWKMKITKRFPFLSLSFLLFNCILDSYELWIALETICVMQFYLIQI
jgi:hypothetical protein